jgi:drug/metabolite transporter (DMT)-like permease
MRRGVVTAVLSGMTYGNYTAFMTLAMSVGVWTTWYGPNSGLSDFGVMFLLSALGAGVTDTCSAAWALLLAGIKGKLGDFGRTLKTKPGWVMVAAAIIGGPLASTCYVVGLQQAGSIIVPISALCPAIGAILARFLFKQPLTPRMLLGIAICLAASFIIGSLGLTEDAAPNLLLGLFFGFLAALGWGIEGCVAGYGTSMIDSEIGITIRQCTSGISNLIILTPLFALIAGADPVSMIGTAFADFESLRWFLVAGFFAYFAFQLWYKGNAMCGAALGMSCNGMFSFWGPFFCWIWIGLAFGRDGWMLHPVAWIAAVVMVIGIFTIAMNPLDLFRRKN